MASVTVLSTTAMQKVLEGLAPGFEQSTGCRVEMHFGPSGRMAKRVGDGEAADVAIVTGAGIDDLIMRGRIAAGSRTDIARSVIGLAIAATAPLPDIGTAEGFKRALLAAKAIAMSNPTGGAQSGAHLAHVFERLGIAEALAPRLIFGPGGPAGLAGKYILRGEADVALQQMPELMAVPGIAIAGPIPAEVQLVTVFSAGLSSAAANPEGGREWIRYLSTPAAAAIVRACGMEQA